MESYTCATNLNYLKNARDQFEKNSTVPVHRITVTHFTEIYRALFCWHLGFKFCRQDEKWESVNGL